MGSAAIKQKSPESFNQPPDLDLFKNLAEEYDKLKACGLSVEEIHNLISSRIEKIYISSSENKNILSSIKSDELSQATESNSKRSISEYESRLEDKPNVDIETFSRRTILLIDDSVVASKSAAKILTNLKFEVTMCNSAQTGFDTLKQSPHKFTLVFLDVVMPKVDGVECLSWIKDDPEIAHIPVYMLSGLEDQTLADVCIERGAEGMLMKPLIPEMINKIFQRNSLTSNNLTSLINDSKFSNNLDQNQVSKSISIKSNIKMLQIGRQAPAFQLYDSDFQEFKYPILNCKLNLLIAFVPTIFFPDLHKPSVGLIDCLKRDFRFINIKTIVVIISRDLHTSLAEAKKIYDIPFTLLSDPTHTVSHKYIGTNHLRNYLGSSQQGNGTYPLECPNLGLILIDKRRNVLKNWCALNADGKFNPNLNPPSITDWVKNKKEKNSNSAEDSKEGETKKESSNEIDKSSQNEFVTRKKLILIVDDSSVSSRLAAKKIGNLGYITEIAYNGQVAHDLLISSPRKYDLVMLDICMPVCDGRELLKLIKTDPKLEHIPIIMLTSLEREDILESYKQEGALEIMKKPFDEEIFLSAMSKAKLLNI